MHGVLAVDKPQAVTSFDVVREVRRALSVDKAGHAGTLDPMATGLLLACVGNATKITQFLGEAAKAYDATVRLGATTDTFDADGRVLTQRPVPQLSRDQLEAVLNRSRGTFEQIPPMYSAVRIAGRRLYDLARAGQEINRKPRQVEVYELTLSDFSAAEVKFFVRASKGFFVRSLAMSIGEALGCGAHLTSLRRIQSGSFTLAQATRLAEIQAQKRAMASRLVSLADALAEIPAIEVSAFDAMRVRGGGVIRLSEARSGLHRIVDAKNELLALACAERGTLRYRRVFAQNA